MRVACLLREHPRHYRRVAVSMAEGIRRCGDHATLCGSDVYIPGAEVAVIYGWKFSDRARRYPHFVYADLGYWNRSDYYRLSVDGWSPERYVAQGKSDERLRSFGVEVQRWNESGDEILVVGAKEKAAKDHGLQYMQWEQALVSDCLRWLPGQKITYRPKPNDPAKRPIPGVAYDLRTTEEALRAARLVVTHHSNMAIDALVAGVPVYCHEGAAAACSIPFQKEEFENPTRDDAKRRQFLSDAAWLQWSMDEMKAGVAWDHLKSRGLFS